jgi:hypothetical protein
VHVVSVLIVFCFLTRAFGSEVSNEGTSPSRGSCTRVCSDCCQRVLNCLLGMRSTEEAPTDAVSAAASHADGELLETGGLARRRSYDCDSDESVKREDHSSLMGIEVETSALKVYSSKRGGFRVGNRPAWTIESDTSDATFAGGPFDSYSRNLECRTVKGWDCPNIKSISVDIEFLIKHLHAAAAMSSIGLTSPMLISTLRNIQPRRLDIKVRGINGEPFFRVKSTEETAVKIQITFTLSFRHIKKVFDRLESLNHHRIPQFLKDMHPATPPTDDDIARKLSSIDKPSPIDVKNVRRRLYIKAIFSQKIAPLLGLISEGNSEGFCYLFLYYWYELFDNTEVGKTRGIMEPGPKRELVINLSST